MWSLHLGRGSSPKPLQLLCKPRAQLQHGPNLVVDPCELSRSRRDHRLHAGVRPRATGPIVRMPGRKRVEGEETLDLAEGESQVLSLPDDREALDVAFGVLSVSGVGPACRRQDAAAFVEADRPHADSAPPGEFADEHAPLSWLPVTSLHFAGKHSERGESSPRWTTAIAPRELYHSRRRGDPMRARLFVSVILICVVTASTRLLADDAHDAAKQEARQAAESWLALVDSERYDDSWSAASSLFRKAVSQEQWQSAVRAARDPFGQ